LVDFSIFPHLDNPELPENTMTHAERWAASLQGPAYAIDDETAIKVTDGAAEVISEGHLETVFALMGVRSGRR
jgi:dipeptidase E